ncbi:DUF305 domain-containing protein [Microtetraspora sp. NBRC 16547]|uniref:DUF305 domain-containing protein n=1 Tax=Microtetraspora sp. NBRC 16547 TaxID=3030993 RepID=UPI0024A435DB|nr:DUF305 domain-containing protein [Microtetraspora sp. NBRC 16547]GLW97065.1 DUF305 domain-containing protein [Microtetraspora sp. NBRC 16547]
MSTETIPPAADPAYPATADDDVAARPRRNAFLPALIGLVVVAAGLLLVVGGSRAPGDTSPEAGFARDMATHHAQAVEMAFAVRDASTDGPIRNLAYDIITTQSTQRGVFMGWLQQWGLDQASDRPPMAWMSGHGHGGATAQGAAQGMAQGAMPGMATPEEMDRLRAAKGRDAEILFLQLMIRHHEGGVDMARGVVRLTNRPEVRELAQHIVDGQTAEITLMKDFLRARGAEPLPSILTP